MLSSPYVRRMLLLIGGYGVICVVILSLVAISVPAKETGLSSMSGVSILRWRMLTTEILLLFFGLLFLSQMARNWIDPLAELIRATRLVSEGKLPERIVAESDDEVERLTSAFDEMAQKIEKRHSELRRSQEQAIRDNQQLETVLEAMVEGVIAVDNEERILHANITAVRLLDLKGYDVVGRRVWETIRLPQIHELLRVTLAGEEQHRLEFPVPWTYRTVAAVASRLPGEPCPGAVLVLHDVTELRRLENLRREFVSNVSHELKTPLSAITAYADTLLNGALDDKEVSRTFVGRICEQSERLNTLILELLELARIESDEHIFHMVTVDINEILRESVDAHQAIAQAKQLRLTAVFAEQQLLAMADPEGLRTIVDNLVGNAINYTKSGGWVVVRSRCEGGLAIFTVEDNGVGIAKEYQTRIFERFFRVDRARSRELGGTGLGLSIVKHLCQLFGGSVKVKSQVGQGSTFTVSLNAGALE